MRRLLVTLILVSALAASSCGSSGPSGLTDATAGSSSLITTTQLASQDVRVNFVYGPPDWPWAFDPTPKGSLLVHGTSGYTGDWRATSTYASAQQSVGQQNGGFSLGVLDGEVTGCGSGQFVFVDAFASNTPTGGWLIVPGFGTRDLASLTGSGAWKTLEGKPGGAAAAGAINGSVTCTGAGLRSESSQFFATPTLLTDTVNTTATFPAPTITWQTTVSPSEGSTATPIVLSDGSVTLHLAGTWTGDAPTLLATATRPSADGGFVQMMVMRFTGTVSGSVSGCGTGSFIVTVLDRFDARDGAGTRLWEIVPDLGTGGLANAQGWGTGTVQTNDDTSTFEGSMSCHT